MLVKGRLGLFGSAVNDNNNNNNKLRLTSVALQIKILLNLYKLKLGDYRFKLQNNEISYFTVFTNNISCMGTYKYKLR